MMKTSKIAIAIILVAIVVMVAPASAAMYHGQIESAKAEKIVEVAEKAEQKVEKLMALVYVNETALELIKTATLLDELEGNVTLFDEGTSLTVNSPTRPPTSTVYVPSVCLVTVNSVVIDLSFSSVTVLVSATV